MGAGLSVGQGRNPRALGVSGCVGHLCPAAPRPRCCLLAKAVRPRAFLLPHGQGVGSVLAPLLGLGLNCCSCEIRGQCGLGSRDACCPPKEGFASWQAQAGVSSWSLVPAPRGDIRHAARVDSPGILGATVIQTGRRLSEAHTGRAPLLGGTCSPRLSSHKPPLFTCTPSNLCCALLPDLWKARSQSWWGGGGA